MTKDTLSNGQDGDRLDSWKKIAAYLGKDVRTALRWSKDEGMPVYRHAGSKRGAIYAYRSEIDEWLHSDRSESPPFYQKPTIVWTGAALVLSLVTAAAFLWLSPLSGRPEIPVAEQSWVLITDFDNLSGEDRFDDMVETALRRELANSRHVLVVAPERIRDTLALMKRSPEATIDAGLGREICLRYGRNCALLTGQVEKFDSIYLLSLEVLDSADGRIVASTVQEAAKEDEILLSIHQLGNWLRENLGEGLDQISRNEEQLERVTTPSLRALELYSSGMRVMYQYRWAEAEALFKNAVEEDSEFASANLFVFRALNNQSKGSEEEAQSFLKRAMELSGSVSEQERYFIEATYYDHYAKDYEKACGTYKTLAELFPAHYWAASNAVSVCGGKLGHREENIRYLVQAAELRADALIDTLAALTLSAGDFNQARPYVQRLRGLIADERVPRETRDIPFWRSVPGAVVATELFAAEELFSKGMLSDVVTELQRVELVLESVEASSRARLAFKLVNFYIALGQFQKARAMSQEELLVGLHLVWLDFLEGDQEAFWKHVDDFHADFREIWPDRPNARLVFLLGLNMQGWVNDFPVDTLVPLYEPDVIAVLPSISSVLSSEFLSWPKFKAKLELARGKQLLNQDRPGEALPHLKKGVRWFRDNGDWATSSYYFLGAELFATTLAEQGDVLAAYGWLGQASERRELVNSYSAPLHQRILARQVLLARKLGRSGDAEMFEAELAKALILADSDHPILVQIREQRGRLSEIE